jgi:PPOX class probable F420-dependent enzyme
MADIDPAALRAAFELVKAESGLAVVSTLRADSTIQSSVVNVGLLPDPLTGKDGLAFVTYGKVKLANLRVRPHVTIAFRNGWQWASVEGSTRLLGPDDTEAGWDQPAMAKLLRDIFTAAGGTHSDWDEYDQTMVEQRRSAVLVAPTRIYGN